MRVAFRCDASLDIGSGHVMRSLTLAKKLRSNGADCVFFSKEHRGNLIDAILRNGFACEVLPLQKNYRGRGDSYASWLGGDWRHDAERTVDFLRRDYFDWLVVDHYALDSRWESLVDKECRRILAVDDLANRQHHCDVLLDQNLGRSDADYRVLVPEYCKLLLGPSYALLRSEFKAACSTAMCMRKRHSLGNLFINMGGVDRDNFTGKVLSALKHITLPADLSVTIVLGASNPWVSEIQALAGDMCQQVKVCVGADNMAELMAAADLAIGAAGRTSWERCCLGLPTFTAVIAENQVGIAKDLEIAGAAWTIDMQNIETWLAGAFTKILANPEILYDMFVAASIICDGDGAGRVSGILVSELGQ